MLLEAQVQSRFPFAGKMREPGDTITADELAQTTLAVRDALVSQKLIVLTGEDGAPIEGIGGSAHVMARLDQISERLSVIEGKMTEGGAQFQGQIDGLRTALRTLAGRLPGAAEASAPVQDPAPAAQAETRPTLTKRRGAAKE